MPDVLDLYAFDGELAIEELPEGNALASTSSVSSVGCLTCPASGSTASTYACFG